MSKNNDDLESFFSSFAQADEQIDFKYAHETVGQPISCIPTGSYVLDNALTSGGLPKGRIIQYYGASGSGKTLMAMIGMLNAQKENPDAKQLFIDAEGTFDPNWASQLGLDTARIAVLTGDLACNGQRCFEMLLGVPREDAKHMLVGKKQEGLLDKIVSGAQNINFIVLDSLGAIIPPGEDVSRIGKFNIAYLARFLTPTFRKLSLEVGKAKVPFVVINHKKDNMDPYAADHTFSGGNAYNHSLSANIYFEAVQRKDAQILDDKEKKIGHTMRATIEKSKFGPWPRKCEFKVNFELGVVDTHEEAVDLAIDYEVITKLSTVSYEYNGEKYVGLAKLQDAVKANPALEAELISKVIQARESKFAAKRAEQEEIKTKKKKKAVND